MAEHKPIMADITDPEIREKIYIEVHMAHIKENAYEIADEMNVELTEDEAERVAWNYVCNAGFESEVGYWDTIKSLIEKCIADRQVA